VAAFRLATAGAAASTQIHTHLCYSEFRDVIDAIDALDALDADVTTIEAARSRMEVLDDLRAIGFDRGVGPGVYDIHSPRVPDMAEIAGLLSTAGAGRARRTVVGQPGLRPENPRLPGGGTRAAQPRGRGPPRPPTATMTTILARYLQEGLAEVCLVPC
jgi:Cobalamin-independent synthase, Catalytic domain